MLTSVMWGPEASCDEVSRIESRTRTTTKKHDERRTIFFLFLALLHQRIAEVEKKDVSFN